MIETAYGGGAPSWVYKQNEAIISSSHEFETSRLITQTKALEAENTKLKTELATLTKRYLALLKFLLEQGNSDQSGHI